LKEALIKKRKSKEKTEGTVIAKISVLFEKVRLNMFHTEGPGSQTIIEVKKKEEHPEAKYGAPRKRKENLEKGLNIDHRICGKREIRNRTLGKRTNFLRGVSIIEDPLISGVSARKGGRDIGRSREKLGLALLISNKWVSTGDKRRSVSSLLSAKDV